MMKILYLSIIILVYNINIIHITTTEKDMICWNKGMEITWENFQGKNLKNSPFSAFTYINMRYEILAGNKILVSNCMNKNKSWVKKDKKTDELLIHEVYHFNIAEVYARKMRKAMKEIEVPSTKSIQSVFDDWLKKYKAEQNQYDNETDLSKNKRKQFDWQLKIDNELKLLKEFEESIVKN